MERVLRERVHVRVRVALAARDVDAEEHGARVAGQTVDVAHTLEDELLRAERVAAVAEEFAKHPIPWPLLPHRGQHVLPQIRPAAVVAAKQRVELRGQMPIEPGRRDEPVDELLTLRRVGRRHELPRLGGRRNAAGEVEREPTHERGVVGLGGGRDPCLPELGVDVVIDHLGDRPVRRQQVRRDRRGGHHREEHEHRRSSARQQ